MSYSYLKTEDKVFVSFAAFMDLLSLCLKEPHYLSQLRDFQYVSTFTNGGFTGEPNDDFYDLILFRSNGYPKLKVSILLDSFEPLDVSFWTYKRGISSSEVNIIISEDISNSCGDWNEDKLLTYMRAFKQIISEDLLLAFGVGLGSTGIFVQFAKALGFDHHFIEREVNTISHELELYNQKVASDLRKER